MAAAGDHRLHRGNPVGRVGLVPGAETEDLAASTGPGERRAEDLPAGEPGDHRDLLGLGDLEHLSVRLLAGDLEVAVEASADRVLGLDDPHPLRVRGDPPVDRAGGANERAEDVRVVARMEADEAHAGAYALDQALDHGIGQRDRSRAVA